MSCTRHIKCVLVGDGAVGKTSILIAYTTDSFPADYTPTVFDNYCKNIMYNGLLINLGLWDTAGQEDYDRLRPLCYPQTDIFIIVFSVIDPTSFDNAKRKWHPELVHHNDTTPIILCASKVDARNNSEIIDRLSQRGLTCVASVQGRLLSEELECDGYYECSALTMTGLHELFIGACNAVLKNNTELASGKKQQQRSTKCILL